MTFALLIFQLIRLFIGIKNRLLFKQLRTPDTVNLKKVDVLIPVKNESSRIPLFQQHIETLAKHVGRVIILDDKSEDNTLTLLKSIEGVTIISGKEKPSDWKGKNWACHQLQQVSNNDFQLFIDVDVIVKEKGLKKALHHLTTEQLDAISVFPSLLHQKAWELIFNDILYGSLIFNIYLPLMSKFKATSYAAANGQFILFKKESYHSWHEKNKDSWIEDVNIFRSMKSEGLKVATFVGDESIACKMYESFKDGINGFSKNIFAGVNHNLLGWLVLMTMNVGVSGWLFVASFQQPFLIVPIILEILILNYTGTIKDLILRLILFPFKSITWFFIGCRSVYWHYLNKTRWR